MLRAGSNWRGCGLGWTAMLLCTLVLMSTTARGQGSTTATVRGNILDSSGAVLPGATVSLTNTGTTAIQTAVADGRGQYLFAGLFPGTYDLKVELSGFKTYERKAIALSPNDNRAIDVRLDVGQQTETVTVTAQQELIQTQTGAREGVLTRGADRQPVGHRPQRARAHAHPPGRRHRVQPGGVGELRRRRQQHPGLHGERDPLVGQHGVARRLVAHRHRQQQRRHRVAQQRHGAGSEGAELELRGRIRHRRHERQRRDQVGQLEVPRPALRLLARPPLRGQRSIQQHRRHAEAEEHLSVPRRQHRRPDHLRRQLHEEPRPAVLLRRARGAVPAGGLGVALLADLFRGDAPRRLQRAAAQPRLEPEQHPAAAHPAGLPQRRAAGAEQRHAAVHDRHRRLLRQPVSAAELQRSCQPLQLCLQPAGADRPVRLQVAVRLEHQQQHQGLRPHRPGRGNRREPARRVVGPVGRGAAVAEHRREPRQVVSPPTSSRCSARR